MTINVETTIEGDSIKNHFDIKHRVDESIEDFHFFCLSILKDLINGNHELDQFGKQTFTYPFDLDEEQTESLTDVITYLGDVIIKKRMDRQKSFNKLIGDN